MWEKISHSHGIDVIMSDRLKVPGGWIVRTIIISQSEDKSANNSAVAQTTIVDPNHEWVLEK